MKLHELHEAHEIDVLWEGELDGDVYTFQMYTVNESSTAGFAKRGGVIRKGGAGKILKFMKNPVVAGLAASYAIDAVSAYRKNKRLTTTFFARDMQERKLYKDIVDTLMKTGKYKKVREKHIDGGIMWVLKRN